MDIVTSAPLATSDGERKSDKLLEKKTVGPASEQFAPFEHRRFKRQAGFVNRSPGDFFSLMNSPRFSMPSGNLLNQLSRPPTNRLEPPSPASNFPRPDRSFPPPSDLGPSLNTPCQRRQAITCNPSAPYRTVDGVCNNLDKPTWGAAMQPLVRMHQGNKYHDGLDVPRIASVTDKRRLLPSPRLVSRLVHEPDRDGQEVPELTNMIQQWGQFLDHDITGTPAHKGPDGKDLRCCDNVYLSDERQVHNDVFNGGECNPIYIPPLDRHFQSTCMSFARSQAYPRRQDCDPRAVKEPREQMNMLTAFIDASQIYGSSLKTNNLIRLGRQGQLRVTDLNMLPEDDNSTCVKETRFDYCLQSGEMRVNEHPALASMHTVFHRFHNFLALQMARANRRWSDERVRHARSYNLRTFGHTLIPSTFTVGRRKIRLHRMFNRPRFVLEENGRNIADFCSGLMQDSVQHFDRYITTDLSDRLFEDKDNISMDLAALNIQRGRDHGLPPYNEYREACGLQKIASFDDLYIEDADRAEVLRRAYETIDDVDLFTGGISERPLAGAMVGPTFACILSRQFKNLKFGDRFWYESSDRTIGFTDNQLREIKGLSMAKIFCLAAPMDRIIANPFYKEGSFLPRPIRLVTGEIISQSSADLLPGIRDILWELQG
ncbi:hypothetical protein EGW08_008036 [Elysia chlorotica]|uniref:Peroxidase n=1 Tax=Elysia chlorotica TaxID=188477 RepID=A0A3S1BB61_ELYCH|nr:hypothetical protein EGW08_008036 [Elysia chlorotica]